MTIVLLNTVTTSSNFCQGFSDSNKFRCENGIVYCVGTDNTYAQVLRNNLPLDYLLYLEFFNGLENTTIKEKNADIPTKIYKKLNTSDYIDLKVNLEHYTKEKYRKTHRQKIDKYYKFNIEKLNYLSEKKRQKKIKSQHLNKKIILKDRDIKKFIVMSNQVCPDIIYKNNTYYTYDIYNTYDDHTYDYYTYGYYTRELELERYRERIQEEFYNDDDYYDSYSDYR